MALDAAQIRVIVTADTAPLAALNQEMGAVSTTAEKMGASFAAASAASTNTTAAMGGTRSAMGAARLEIGALEGSTRSMALGLEHVAAESKIVGPLLQAAFLPFAAIAVGAILEQAYEAFGKLSDGVMGYSEEVQKAEKEDVKFSTAALEHAQTLVEAEDNLRDTLAQVGSTGADTYLQRLTAAEKEHGSVLLTLLGPLGDTINEYEALSHAEADAADQAARMNQVERAQQVDLMDQVVALDRQALTLAREKASADEAGATSAAARTRIELEALKTEEKIQEDIAAHQAGLKAEKEGGNAVPAEEAARAAIQEEYYLKELGITRREGLEIQKQQTDEYKKSADALEREEKGMQKFEEGYARSLAEGMRAIDEEASAVGKLTGEMALAGAKTQLDAFMAGVRADVGRVEDQIRGAEATAQAKERGIGESTFLTVPQKQRSDLSVITEQYNAEKTAVDALVAQLQAEQAAAQQSAGSDEEKASTIARLQEEIDRLTGKLIPLKAKMDELAQDNWPVQLGNKVQSAFSSMNNTVDQSLNRWITGHETFKQAAYRTWTGIADNAIMSMVKMTERWIEQKLIEKIVGTASASEQAAAKVAADKAAGLSAAGLAGAAGTASFAAAPWPIDMGAPAFGAAMLAVATGFMAFEKGGIMPYDAPAYLHAGEMVLPERISTFVQEKVASPASAGDGGGDTHLHFSAMAMDAKSFTDFFSRNRGAAMKEMARAFRNGARLRR